MRLRCRLPQRLSYFSRLILAFILYTLVMVGVSGVVMRSTVTAWVETEIAANHIARLSNIRTLFKDTLLAQYESVLIDRLAATMNLAYTTEINTILATGSRDPLLIRSLAAEFSVAAASTEGILNISAVFLEADFIVTASCYFEHVQRSPEIGFIESIDASKIHSWSRRVVRDTSNLYRDVLTYIHTLPYMSTGERIKGYILIDTDIDYMVEALGGQINHKEEGLVIFSADGVPLLSIGTYIEDRMKRIQELLRTDTDGILRQSDMVVSRLRPERANDFGFAVVGNARMFYMLAERINRSILQVSLAAIFIGLVLSVILSRYFYEPTRRMIERLAQYDQGITKQGQSDEFHLLDLTLHSLQKRIDYLASKVRNETLCELLETGVVDEGVGELGLPSDASYMVVACSVDKTLRSEFREQIEAFGIGGKGDFGRVECCEVNDTILYALHIFKPAEDLPQEVLHRYYAAMLETDAWTGGVHIGIGMMVHEPGALPISKAAATKAIDMHYILEDEPIISSKTVDRCTDSIKPFDLDALHKAIREGQRQEIKVLFKNFRRMILENHSTRDSVELELIRVLSTILKIPGQYRLYHLFPSGVKKIKELRDFKTLSQAVEWMSALFIEISDAIHASGDDRHTATIMRLKEYIDAHIEEDISLDRLAELGSLSPSYISTLFKEVLQESFVEYLSRTRLERAAELLRGEISPSVKETAYRAGYRNIRYFSTQFKAHFGITPASYRDLR